MESKCNHTDGDRHDCDYVDWRNGLVELAVAKADRLWPRPRTTDEELRAWSVSWDKSFHENMSILTAPTTN